MCILCRSNRGESEWCAEEPIFAARRIFIDLCAVRADSFGDTLTSRNNLKLKLIIRVASFCILAFALHDLKWC